MSLLLNEKLKHVEILRQIHSDINMMEAVMKQSQDEHTVTLNRVRSIFKEFETVRATVNDLRHETHLPVLTDPVLEYIDTEAPKLIGTHSKPQRSKQILLAKSQPKPEKPAFPMAPAPAKRSRSSAEAHPPNMPPMKQCSTCHQHIHRNAPICPLCKAKLRSRNPKKPRK